MSAIQDELTQQIAYLESMLADIFTTLRHASPDDLELADALQNREILASPSLALIREQLDNLIGGKLTAYRTTVPGVGVVERHEKVDPRKPIDDDALWRTVLDTRFVDPETGEVTPQHEVIRRVYGSKSKETGEVRLTGATPSKLEAAGFPAADSYFTEKVRRPGWTLRVYN